MPKSNNHTITIDATGQSLGRLASRVAVLLQDKNKAVFEPNKIGENIVVVNNLSKVKFKGTKTKTKMYRHPTGYLGHLKETSLEELWAKNPKKVLILAVKGMLPKNKLRERRLKHLIINL
ncbi:MAG: large subunit ribosomal protein [Patescibacteria group bacterium]|nr:large subunit ribosomal protein [Patescibacteria group bacterium]